MWYSMNKKPFVDEVNMYALLDAIETPSHWSERIKSIMGYVPHEELFFVEEQGVKQARYEIAYKLLKKDWEVDKVSEVTGLTCDELSYLTS
jgi:hypothetical protein